MAEEKRKPHTFTRQNLYELVWSEPMRLLATKYGITDKGLAKACTAASIPVPERGYWAKLAFGKKVSKQPLPPRPFGRSDQVTIGGRRRLYDRHVDSLSEPTPPPPVFETDMDTVRAQVGSLVSKAPLPMRITAAQHPMIAKLFAEDVAFFNTPFEFRRMKILNALFLCLQHCGMKPAASGKQGRDLSVLIGETRVSFSLDTGDAAAMERQRRAYYFLPRKPEDPMRLAFEYWQNPQKDSRSWQDGTADRLERRLREIAVELIILGEQRHRHHLISERERRIKWAAYLEDEAQKRRTEEEHKRKERQTKAEQQRIDHLLEHAQALHRATQIRAYVAAVREANQSAPQPMTDDDLASWTHWALAQADRIDPIVSGAYKTCPPEPAG